MNARAQIQFNADAAAFTAGNPMQSARFKSDGSYDFEAGQERISQWRRSELARFKRLNDAIAVIRVDLHTDDEALRLLHAMAHSYTEFCKPVANSDRQEVLDVLTQAADDIQFRNEAQG